jgi:hypothetical protein
MFDRITKVVEIIVVIFIIAFLYRFCNRPEPVVITETVTITDTVFVTITDTQFVTLPAVVDVVYLEKPGDTVVLDTISSQMFEFKDDIYHATFNVKYSYKRQEFDVDFKIDIKQPIITTTITEISHITKQEPFLSPFAGINVIYTREEKYLGLNAGFSIKNKLDIMATINERVHLGILINYRF